MTHCYTSHIAWIVVNPDHDVRWATRAADYLPVHINFHCNLAPSQQQQKLELSLAILLATKSDVNKTKNLRRIAVLTREGWVAAVPLMWWFRCRGGRLLDYVRCWLTSFWFRLGPRFWFWGRSLHGCVPLVVEAGVFFQKDVIMSSVKSLLQRGGWFELQVLR